MVLTFRAYSCCRCRSTGAATCVASSSAPTARIHHANIRVDATKASAQLDERDAGPDTSTASFSGRRSIPTDISSDGHQGEPAPLLPAGLAWTLEPNSDLVVQVHLVPGGKPEPIQPSISFIYTDNPPTQTPVMMRLSNQRIDIPPGDAESQSLSDSFVLPVNVEVLALQPHAHYLARIFQRQALLPDGSSRSLISIPDWDLRWQHVYRYQTPVALPKGTTISMRYRYDNSASNPP